MAIMSTSMSATTMSSRCFVRAKRDADKNRFAPAGGNKEEKRHASCGFRSDTRVELEPLIDKDDHWSMTQMHSFFH